MITGKEVTDPSSLDNEDVANASKNGVFFEFHNGLLYHSGIDSHLRLCVPHGLIDRILAMAHDDQHHFGKERMTRELQGFCIKNLTRRIAKHLHKCPTCCTGQTSRQQKIGSYQPIRVPVMPMHTIALDFITEMPPVTAKNSPWALEGYDVFDQLMTVTCAASKRCLLIPGYSTYGAKHWATVLARQLMLSDWGIPKVIISDRDRKFTSDFWQGLWKGFGTKIAMTTAYHPQADGLAERRNQTVEIALRFHYMENPHSDWTAILPALQWNLNGAYNAGTKMTAHEFIYGVNLRGPLESLQPETEWSDLPFVREAVRKEAQLAMDFAAAKAKRYYDAKHRPIQLKVGDKVYLKLHHGYNLPGNPPKKWSPQRAGPFEVIQMVGDLACKLALPPTIKIHPVISCQHLEPAHADAFQPEEPGPVEVEDNRYEVERLLRKQVRHFGRNRTAKEGYMVRWKGFGPEHDVWVSAADIDSSLIEAFNERYPDGSGEPLTQLRKEKGRRGRPKKTSPLEKETMKPKPKGKRGRPRKQPEAAKLNEMSAMPTASTVENTVASPAVTTPVSLTTNDLPTIANVDPNPVHTPVITPNGKGQLDGPATRLRSRGLGSPVGTT
ncbi:MAG: DDE-type integrase/transposase/recombinase, partial [Propionibacteriaceae bacterium]|nr:DDE-type integrase/transposase/recombinase [Propionibacteriaceae bacterium]